MTVVRVTPDAYADADAAAAGLETARTGYGARFTAAFRKAVSAIRAFPRMYPEADDSVPGVETREFFIARYGYRVIYTYDGTEAVVVAVVHAARRPGFWHRRLPDTN
jgi:plasmid stabilization system protein ParE